MKNAKPTFYSAPRAVERGFALVVTLSLMILLTVIAVGLLTLSTISLRSAAQGYAQAEARANARMALIIAIGELQKEMGPDTRISSESALLDTKPDTEAMEGVTRSHWLASYNAWGDWLNSIYISPDIGTANIYETYSPGRERMFRRWLLSLPDGMEKTLKAPVSPADSDDKDWVSLVDTGSLGKSAKDFSDRVTRAYKTSVGKGGKFAWWIGPENHKAKVTLTGKPRTLAAAEWQESQGTTAEVGVGSLEGFSALDSKSELGSKLITTNTLRLAPIEKDKVDERFFDLTAASQGVVASVRGTSKKDLSLLFEMDASKLPATYKYTSGSDFHEPSIRPMSPELQSIGKAKERQFASWTNMRHYYRMYRETSDATTRDAPSGGTGSPGMLKWSGSQPYTESQIPLLYRDKPKTGLWLGDNAYLRLPILAKLTFIYSLVSEQFVPGSTTDLRYRIYLVYTPVFTYWNPYNTELRIPDNTLGCLSSTYQVLPMRTQLYLGNVPQATPASLFTGNAHSFLRSGSGSSEIIFKPGEIRLFSHKVIGPQNGGQLAPLDLAPGFNPLAYGGDRISMGTYLSTQKPGVMVQFSHSQASGNVGYGNTPGSLCHTPFWLPKNENRDLAFNWNFPVMYQNDWFNLAQTYTPMTPEVAPWLFTDSNPAPVAYAQLVIKGMSPFSYESIAKNNPSPNNWAKDWRCRNWISSPPFYFGNDLYMSEDAATAHTQRLDNPYVMNFGPLSDRELPAVVGHTGNSAFLGSGSNPYENVTSASVLELPTAPISSLAGFSGMRINPGWTDPRKMNSNLNIESTGGNDTSKLSYYYSVAKMLAYQSGVTGPGIGNSFMHPMLPRTDIYQYFNNSISADPANRTAPLDNINYNDSKVFCDYWDHVFLLNDALWDDYFVSSLADQKRPPASTTARSLSQNLGQLVAAKDLSNIRYRYYSGGKSTAEVKSDLQTDTGYLKAARYLMVDGMFNVNSTSVAAWQALFTGIRERQLVYRDSNGSLRNISVPAGKRIALSRFDTEISDKEMSDAGSGATLPDGSQGWTGVRYLDDDQLLKLAQECVKQVKQRGPFLNFSEFINRRLSNDKLGLRGALQSAIDYDDDAPDVKSINYRYKKEKGSKFMIEAKDLGATSFSTPEAVNGSRLAGIPGYLIQSDLLKPISNTLAVRDDTFRIRTYGQANDVNGKVIATAYCEAIVQRVPEYCDPANTPDVPTRLMGADGTFSDNSALTAANRRFGRKFQITSFRWLNKNEV